MWGAGGSSKNKKKQWTMETAMDIGDNNGQWETQMDNGKQQWTMETEMDIGDSNGQ